MKYIIVESDSKDGLIEIVNENIESGYIPLGNATITDSKCFQTMYNPTLKKEDQESAE